ncbi:MAG: hypothetical protein HRU15_09770, partial [Planctomycetes bacterium]|nr:hypothetical protein [Planctomycetota bacterium]
MSSLFARLFHLKGRPLIRALHGEVITIIDNQLSTVEDYTVTWLRIDPEAENSDGLGIDTFYAKAQAIISYDDLLDPHGALIIMRNGEAWQIHLAELQDEWTWKLHL